MILLGSTGSIGQLIVAEPNKQKKWRLGTPLEYKEQIGIHISESCQKYNPENSVSFSYSAFKPLSRRTQLRYFADDFPKEYQIGRAHV